MTAPIACIDHISMLEMMESQGVVRSLRRLARVINLDVSDYTVLIQSLNNALDHNGNPLPSFGSKLDIKDYPDLSALVLVERTVKLVDGDKGIADVTLGYQHFMESYNQQLDNGGVIYGKTRSSVSQKTTNFYYEIPGDPTSPKVQVVLDYTYPLTSKAHPGETVFQGGEFNVMIPQTNYKFMGYIYTEAPWNIAYGLISCINGDPWLHQPAFTWMCTEVEWEVLNPTPGPSASNPDALPFYRMGFEFQNNYDKWLYYPTFIDAESGKPPPEVLTQPAAVRSLQIVPPLFGVGPPSNNPINIIQIGTWDAETGLVIDAEGHVLPQPYKADAVILSTEAIGMGGQAEVHYHKEVDFDQILGNLFEGWLNLE